MPSGASGAELTTHSAEADNGPVILAHELPFRIGEAQFSPSTREVLFAGRAAVIEPRVMQALVALNRAHGSVVSKDDLAARCWDSRVVGEDAINRVISRLRAVGERQAGGQFRVETITKVGYRLVNGTGSTAPGQPLTRDPASSIGRRELVIGSTAAIAATGLGALGWHYAHRDQVPDDVRALIEDGRSSLYQGTVEQIGNGVGKLRQAVQLAPDNAEAWGLLALAYVKASMNSPAARRPDLLARASEAVRRAFALDADQPDALVARTWMLPQLGNWYAVETAARDALRRAPKSALVNFALAKVLVEVGRNREAQPFYAYTLEQLPLAPPVYICASTSLWALGRLDEADRVTLKAIDLLPRHYGVWFTRLYYLAFNGRAGEAVAMIDDIDSRPLGIPDWNYDATAMQIKALASGRREDLRRTIDAWRSTALKGSGFAENAALFAAFAGDYDEAFRLLNGIYFGRGFRLPDTYFSREQQMFTAGERTTHALFDRRFLGLRRDSRFRSLTRELGLDAYWARTNSRALVTA